MSSFHSQVTIVYHTDLLDTWMEPAKELRAVLKEKSGAKELHLVGRSKNQKIELDRDFVIEKLDVDGQSFIQKQVTLINIPYVHIVCSRFCNMSLILLVSIALICEFRTGFRVS